MSRFIVIVARVRPILFLAACLLLAGCNAQKQSGVASTDTVAVLSFNIRYGHADDGEDSWPYRKDLVFDVIRRRNSDFVGLQEALRFQIDAILDSVPGYGMVGVGRDGGAKDGEFSAILYRQERWQADASGTFWLSDTPELPGSKTWGNQFPRIVTWGRFMEAGTGNALWVFNTHFDHVSQPSRLKSAKLLAERIASLVADEAFVVTGDFNAGEDNPAITWLTDPASGSPVTVVDAFRVLHPDEKTVGTFNEFSGRRDGDKIDYVFIGPASEVIHAGISLVNDSGRYPSDHFPVYAELQPAWPAAGRE